MSLIRRLKHALAVLATFSALLNVWVLAVHTQSVISAELHATAGHDDCPHMAAKADKPAQPHDQHPTPSKTCPICSGLASLHIGIFAPTLLIIITADQRATTIAALQVELALDHRPFRPLNRGPPLLI